MEEPQRRERRFGGARSRAEISSQALRAREACAGAQTGGAQERRRRAGTENIAYIVGFATALQLAYEEADRENARLEKLRDTLIAGVRS